VRRALGHKYEVKRADEPIPGLIDKRVFIQLQEAPLVVADLSGHNPNVFYELAVRHLLRKPFIQMIDKNDDLPFDIAKQNTIFFDISSLTSVEEAKKELRAQEELVSQPDFEMESPVAEALRYKELEASDNPMAGQLQAILDELVRVRRDLTEVKAGTDGTWIPHLDRTPYLDRTISRDLGASKRITLGELLEEYGRDEKDDG